MGLLAEARHKQKWSHDPRGKKWSEDKNKISVKMMEKMGWTQGNGLGAKEDGRTEHVKIKFKDEKRGVGCSLKYDRQWIAHQDSFNDLLAGLNSGESTESKPILADKAKINSLEKTGDKAGHRYRKFTKGKDLTNASSKHLEEIFGRSTASVKADADKKEAEDKAEEEKRNKNKSLVCETGEFKESEKHIVQEESVADYFKRKMALRMAALENRATPLAIKNESCDNETVKSEEVEDLQPGINSEETDGSSQKKKKRKKKNAELESVQTEEHNSTNEEQEPVQKKKKKKRKKTEDINEGTVENSVEVLVEDSQTSKKHKKRKKASCETDKDIDVTESVEIAETELPLKKKKKKRKKELESVEKAVDSIPEECPDEKPKKRKKKKKSSDSS